MSSNITADDTHNFIGDDTSLKELFYKSFKLYYSEYRNEDMDDGFDTMNINVGSKNVVSLIQTFQRIAYCVETASLFSLNEELEDIITANLIFILVPFVLGELSSHPAITEDRILHLENSIVYWRQFLVSCEAFNICDKKTLNRIRRENILDGSAKRLEKIESYKQNCELNAHIKFLIDKKRQKVSDPYTWGSEVVDEETERMLIRALIQRSINEALQHEELVEQEIKMIQMRENMLAKNGTIKSVLVEPKKKPFMLTIKDPSELRKLYRNKVFQPYHELPSVSLSEVAAWEMNMEVNQIGAKGRDKQKRKEEKVEAEKNGYEVDESSDENSDDKSFCDAKELKSREWDDWKDENPKGSGNKNRNVG